MRYRAKTLRLGPLYATVTRSGRRVARDQARPVLTQLHPAHDVHRHPRAGRFVHRHGRPKGPVPDFLPSDRTNGKIPG
jgi:hypothetical protein